jgi:polyphosphate kinase
MDTPPYIKRDISWLSFNHRVLQEAMDERVPLYERIKFLAIYSSNLDEFFRVRVASLRSFKQLKKKIRKELEVPVKPKRQLREIRKIVQEQQEQFGKTFRGSILPALEQHHIYLINNDQYTEAQQEFVRKYFFEKVYPILNPIMLQAGETPPFLDNKQLYFVVTFEGLEDLAIVEIPTENLPRFIELPATDGTYPITFLDDIIRFNLDRLLHIPPDQAYGIKLSRDAEMYIDDEYSGDLVAKIRESLEARNIGLPTRFLYDSRMPKELLDRLKQMFQLTKNDIIPGARYHNFNDFFGFPDPTNNPALHDTPLPALPHPNMEGVDSILALIGEKDQVLHFPYQRYDYVPKLIWEAANDPAVEAIKITLYRVAAKSAIVEAMLHATTKGKKVTAFIEAKARFDEASNLYWGDKLKEAGAKVHYSYPGIKVHSKLLLITRKEDKDGEEVKRHYAYIGTGNFNEKTSGLYGDHALLTAKQKITKEVNQVFQLLTRKIMIPQCKHILVAPFTLQPRFAAMIDREIANAQAGLPAYMILKMNSLENEEMIDKLYEASQAGVRIQLIVRGICCLVPGVEGQSENIEIISIVDRYLEHARVYIFGNNGEEEMYIASADWMTRNLHQRVEVAVPIHDSDVYAQIRKMVDIQLLDNTKARIIDATQSNSYRQREDGTPEVSAQLQTYAFLKDESAQRKG